jgi:hypothetical protein
MFTVQTTATVRPLRPGALAFTSTQMQHLGTLGIALIRERVARGVGSDDAPMKPLNARYARYKGYKGLPRVRNLRGPGNKPHMLDNISVRRAVANSVRIDITSSDARTKAAANEKRSPWYGWSPRDASVILTDAQKIARGNIREVTAERGLSIWMDPRRLRSTGYRRAT